MDLIFPTLFTLAVLYLWIRSATNNQQRQQDVNLDRFVTRNMPVAKKPDFETTHEESSPDVPVDHFEPLFVSPVPEELDAYCEIETPYQNFFLELPFKNISRSREFIISKTKPLIEIAQDSDFNISTEGYSSLRIRHFLRWKHFDPRGAEVFCELDLSFDPSDEATDFEGNRTCFDGYCEVRIDTSEGDEIYLYSRFSSDKPLRSITSARKCLVDYRTALRTAADRPDLLIPEIRHSDLPSLEGIGERDRFRIVRRTRDGELEAHDICDLKVGIYSLRRDLSGTCLRESGIKWLSAYSKQKCGIIKIKLSSVESISPSIKKSIPTTEKLLLSSSSGRSHLGNATTPSHLIDGNLRTVRNDGTNGA